MPKKTKRELIEELQEEVQGLKKLLETRNCHNHCGCWHYHYYPLTAYSVSGVYTNTTLGNTWITNAIS